MFKKLLVTTSAFALAVASVPMFAAFEAHVINVTAKIENALNVHPQSLEFGTVFPQEALESSFFISFSTSFSETNQRRVGSVDYVIKQKPKPRPAYETQVGAATARAWCHDNYPTEAYPGTTTPGQQEWTDYLLNCYPSLCPYLSKHPDGRPSPGNDTGVNAFHDPWDPASYAHGKLMKFNQFGSTINNDPSDDWVVDLKVPCFKGSCAQDWADFVHAQSPSADPDAYTLPPQLEHEVFGCDLWVEVTRIYSESGPQLVP